MAEGFELYHIPQQSRREKLRVVLQNHHTTGCLGDTTGLGLLPFYDQSPFISSSQKLLPCANAKSSLMANNTGSNASDYRTESLGLQSVHDLVYRHQDLRFIQHHDHAPYRGGDFVALSLSSQNTGVNLQSYGGGGSGGDFGRSVVMPLGPYTGYASILKGSKFLKPAQEVLDEICDVGFGIYAEKFAVDSWLMTDPPPLENLRTSVDDRVDKRKSSRLISLLEEVYKRYKQYYQQMHEVIASFETVAGLSSAAPFANLDVKAMSKHFHSLKNAITEQLKFSVKPHEHHLSYKNKEFMWSAVDNMGFVDHQQPVWRPQRGLPKRAVTVLRSWLFDHFLHPYPTDTDKQLLAKQTGLSRNQVSNWFINARVRLWKPMVEEVHTLETKQVHSIPSHIQQQDTSSSLGNSFLSHPMNQKPPSKRTRNDGKYNHQHIMEGNKDFYENLSIQSGSSRASANVGQNRNIFTLSEPFPVNDGGRERFVVGGLYAQNRQ